MTDERLISRQRAECPAYPNMFNSPNLHHIMQLCCNGILIHILPLLYSLYIIYAVQTGRCVCVCLIPKAFFPPFGRSVHSPGETCGSHVDRANGQLMGLQTARLVTNCLQIKQFVILCVCTYTHTHRHSIHT